MTTRDIRGFLGLSGTYTLPLVKRESLDRCICKSVTYDSTPQSPSSLALPGLRSRA